MIIVATLPHPWAQVKLHRTGGRLGLIQARLIGGTHGHATLPHEYLRLSTTRVVSAPQNLSISPAKLAEAPILTFLDSHIEVAFQLAQITAKAVARSRPSCSWFPGEQGLADAVGVSHCAPS